MDEQQMDLEQAEGLYAWLQDQLGADSEEWDAVVSLMADCANRALAEVEGRVLP
ncbi:hypothetical protein ACFPA8_07865 [Streptomyces ovatisporus]|uniref:Uncharacterized protein n=1 Tax=Streptomyces ovatisporus TaxID=1128682 RepID=A0ABV9A270_9ACTN